MPDINNFLIELGNRKDADGLTWQNVADIINEKFGLNYSEKTYRIKYAALIKNSVLGEDSSIVDMDVEERILELQKQKVKVSDERNQTRAYVRQLSREETIKDIAFETAIIMAGRKPLLTSSHPKQFVEECSGILELSDWHYGMDFKNPWNTYNPEVAVERIQKLKNEVCDFCRMYRCKELHVLNLADLIAGRIHLGIRFESRIDVITQTLEVSELLAEFLSDLSLRLNIPIHYYGCVDNHSRLEPNKNDALNLESLSRITDWYMKERFEGTGVICHDNEFGEDIITLNVQGHNVLGVHGDRDKQSSIIDKLSTFTRQNYDLICTAHMHHFSADENNLCNIVCNGSLMGTDNYAKNLRLNSPPSQNFIAVTPDNVTYGIHKILLG